MDKTASILQALASQLKVSVEDIIQMLVKQAYLSGIIDLIQYATVAGVSAAWYFVAKKTYGKIKEMEIDSDWGIALLIGTIIISAFWLVIFISLGDTITAFVHPQYWAYKQIINKIK